MVLEEIRVSEEGPVGFGVVEEVLRRVSGGEYDFRGFCGLKMTKRDDNGLKEGQWGYSGVTEMVLGRV